MPIYKMLVVNTSLRPVMFGMAKYLHDLVSRAKTVLVVELYTMHMYIFTNASRTD